MERLKASFVAAGTVQDDVLEAGRHVRDVNLLGLVLTTRPALARLIASPIAA